MYELALALALITSPAPDEKPSDPGLLPCRLSSMQAVAIALEVMDEQERRYTFADGEDWGNDLVRVQENYADLALAPPACDCGRWPDRSLLSDLCALNREYRQWLVDWYDLSRDAWVLDAISECDQLYSVYDTARDCCCGYYYVTVRRRSLKRLRDMIGAEDYYAGRLPPHVPIWRFSPID